MANLGLMHKYKSPNQSFLNMARVRFKTDDMEYTYLIENKFPQEERLFIKDSSLCLVEIFSYDEEIEEVFLSKGIELTYFEGYEAFGSSIKELIEELFPRHLVEKIDYNLFKDLEENRYLILDQFNSAKTELSEILKGKSEERVCSKCGAAMILRRSVRGEFYGCSSFPNCRATQQVDTRRKTFDSFGGELFVDDSHSWHGEW